MASPRYLFGSGASDFAIAPPSRHGGFVVSAANLGNGTLWSASSGGIQYTDLQTVNGGAISTVSTDDDGGLVAFYGPPGVDGAWLDFGGGSRAFLPASRGQDAHVAGLLGDSASASAVALASAVATVPAVTNKVGKGELVANVKDYGAVGDGVTDDTSAIQSCIAANNNVYVPPGTYLVEGSTLVVTGRTGFRLDMAGRFKRKDNSLRGSTLTVFNSSDVRIRSFRSDGNVTNNLYSGLPVDEAKHCLRIDGSTDVEIGQVDSVNPAGDAVYVTGATARLSIGTVTSRSSTPSGRNTVSIVSGDGIKIDAVRCYGTGYTTMPSGFDIEPNSGQTVSNVSVGSVYSYSSGTGGFSVYGNYTVGGVRQINRVKVGQVTVVKAAGTQTNACDVPIRGVNDLTVQSISVTQDAAATNQAIYIDDADSLDLFVDIPASRGTVPPTIGATAPVTNMRLRGRVGLSGSHCLNIYALSDSEIDMKLRSPGSGVLIVKNAIGTSSNVRFRGDWRKVSGAAAMQINGTVDWQVDADVRDWPTSQLVIGTGAAGVSNKSPNSQAVFSFTAAGQSSWTCPLGAKTVRVVAVGAGGGGGSGRRDAAGVIRWGGGGGGAGSRSEMILDGATYAGTALTVTVGAGGAGAAAVSTDTTSGSAGTTGGWSGLGTGSLQANTLVNANGGTGGTGGTATAGSGGLGVAGTVVGSTGGAGSNGSAAGSTSLWAVGTTGGAGGGGGGITAANAAAAGGGGGFPASAYPAYTGGGAAGVNGTDGANSTAPTQGYGGGGGGAANGGAAGNGGNGGTPGGAGGGGGASVNGTNSGAGGAGANGAVQIIVTY